MTEQQATGRVVKTQYRVTFRGGDTIKACTIEACEEYIERAVAMRGQDPADYDIEFRQIVYGPWAQVGE